MGKIKFTAEDKKVLREHVKNLPIFPRFYKEGNKRGQLIFETRRCLGSEAIARGFKKDEYGNPINPKGKYTIPYKNVMSDPYEYFMKQLEKQDKPIDEILLDDITRNYLDDYATSQKIIAEASAKANSGDQSHQV